MIHPVVLASVTIRTKISWYETVFPEATVRDPIDGRVAIRVAKAVANHVSVATGETD